MRKTDVLDTLEPLRAVCKDELAEYKVTELLDSLAQDSFDKIHPYKIENCAFRRKLGPAKKCQADCYQQVNVIRREYPQGAAQIKFPQIDILCGIKFPQ